MALELLAVDFIFGCLLKRKPCFLFRAAVSVIVCAEVIVLTGLVYYKVTGSAFSYSGAANMEEGWGESIFKFAYYFIIFLLIFICMCCCYGNSPLVILFYCSGGYAAQHIAKNIASMVRFIPAVSAILSRNYWIMYLIELAVCTVMFTLVYFLFVRGKMLSENAKGVRKKMLVSLFVVLICIGLSRLTTDDATRSDLAALAETLYAIASCVLVLFLLSSLTENDKMQNEVEMMSELLHRERERYKYEKDNIELINIKCHDLKHQINALRLDASESRIREIEEAVMIYSSVVKTGNDVLDVILTEKSLYCEKHHIHLTCVVRGEALSFMENMDIYSLFGNALSNAIEEVSKIDDEERRVISMNVDSNGNFLTVHVENFYDGEIKFEDGLPQTRRDKNYHGFGMKSMRYIAKRYGGFMSVSAEDGKFRLNIVFPLRHGSSAAEKAAKPAS